MDEKQATIYQIAKLAGVSIGTVSRVINGKDRVAPETRARVLAVAEKFQFRPNAAAKGLATRRTNAIMMLVSDIGNIYFAEMAKQLSHHASAQGLRVMLGDSDETVEKEAEYLRTLGDGHVDGAIVAPLTTDANLPLYAALIKRRFPLILMDTELHGVETDCVRIDNEAGAQMAVEYLHSRGHQHIAFVSGDINFQTNRLRYKGYRDTMERLGLGLRNEHLVLNQDFLHEEGFCGIAPLLRLSNRPTAIFASSDLTAMACIHTVRRAGLRVPEDVAVIGFDDLRISAHMEVPLTTINQPKDEIAGNAVRLLHERMQDREATVSGSHVLLIKPRLVVRASA